VLLVGLATLIRLAEANVEDMGMVVGMNRLRHAYLEVASELEPYFVTGHHDDEEGVRRSYGLPAGFSLAHLLAGTPNLVGAIDVVVAGVLAAVIADTLGASDAVDVAAGVATALVFAAGLAALAYRTFARARRASRPRFPA
jgi:hypothetical protein